MNQLGHQFDQIVREVDQPLQSRPHNRSTMTGAGRRGIDDDQRSVDCKLGIELWERAFQFIVGKCLHLSIIDYKVTTNS